MQFDVYENKNTSTNRRFPYLLDVQADLLKSLETRVVVPLAVKKSAPDLIVDRLMPAFVIKGKSYVALTPQIAGIQSRDLGPIVTNLMAARPDIIAALDLIFTGV